MTYPHVMSSSPITLVEKDGRNLQSSEHEDKEQGASAAVSTHKRKYFEIRVFKIVESRL